MVLICPGLVLQVMIFLDESSHQQLAARNMFIRVPVRQTDIFVKQHMPEPGI
jgi:hypothetical protein